MNYSTILSIVNLVFLVAFLVIVIGLLISGLIGFKRGIFKSAFKLILMAVLFVIAIATLDPIVKLLYTAKISFLPFKTIVLTNSSNPNLVYYASIGNLYDTTSSVLEGIYYLFNISASSKDAHAFSLALAGAVIKYSTFMFQMTLIVTLGNALGEILWGLVFKKLIPAAIRNKGKLGGMVVNAVKFLCVTLLFISPFTIYANMINQQYHRFKKTYGDNQVTQIGSFIDAYNSSIFASLFFNWSVNGDGLTFDAAFIDKITTNVVDGTEISLIDELNNLIGFTIPFVDGVTGIGEQTTFDYTIAYSSAVIQNIFDSLANSNLITLMLPIAAQIATNMEYAQTAFDFSHIDAGNINWSDELKNVGTFTSNLLDTGIMDEFLDENGQFKKFDTAATKALIAKMLVDEREATNPNKPAPFEAILSAFEGLANSKLLDAAIAGLINSAILSNKELAKNLPIGWDDISNISWGTEAYILLDALHELYKVDTNILDVIFASTEKGKTNDEKFTPLFNLIAEHCANETEFGKIKQAFVGTTDETKLDSIGRTVVFKNGKRIEDRHFCLLDLTTFRKIAIPYLTTMLDQDYMKGLSIDHSDVTYVNNVIDEMNQGAYLKNYKQEFSTILDVLGTIGCDKEFMLTIPNGFKGLIENNNFLTLDPKHVNYLSKAIAKVDDTKLLYSILTPILKGLFNSPDMATTMSGFGISTEIMAIGLDRDMKRSNHNLYHEFANIFGLWTDIQTIYEPLINGASDATVIINALSTEEGKLAVAKVLSTFQTTSFFNPDPEVGDPITFEHNENFYRVLEMVFGYMSSMNIEVTRDTLRAVENNGHKWANEFNGNVPVVNSTDGKYGECWYIANIISYIGQHNFLDILNIDLQDSSSIRKITGTGAGDYNIGGLFAAIDDSVLFSSLMGDFIDGIVGTYGILDDSENMSVSFKNVTSWKAEGENFVDLLNALADIIESAGSDFLTNFDVTRVSDIPALNTLLHKLANSDIFKKKISNADYTYTFGKFLYNKVKPILSSFNLNGSNNLIADPKQWNANYGDRPSDSLNPDPYFAEYYNYFATSEEKAGTSDTYYLIYRDFVSINGETNENNITPWCDMDTYETLMSTFENKSDEWKGDNSFGTVYGSDAFVNAYRDIFEIDEIGRVCKVLTYVLRFQNMGTITLDSLSSKQLKDILYSLNDSCSLKIAVYNFANIAKKIVSDDTSASSIISLENAYMDYFVSADMGYKQYEAVKQAKKIEIDYIVSIIDTYQTLTSSGVIDSGVFDATKLNDSCLVKIETMLKNLNKSVIFHRHGSSLSEYEPTVFQSLLEAVLSKSGVESLIYQDDSPKDIYYQNEYKEYIDTSWAIATTENKNTAKLRYILDNTFLSEDDYKAKGITGNIKELGYANQENEISNLIRMIAMVNGNTYQGVSYSPILTPGMSIDSLNMETIVPENVASLLKQINNSFLYDVTPNILNSIFNNITLTGGINVNFSDASCYYTYSKLGTVSTDYTRKVSEEEIDRIADIIYDYQDFKSLVGSGNFSDVTTIKNLINSSVLETLLGHIHESEILHVYNDNNQIGSANLTVFEQLIKEVATIPGLDELAYNSTKDASYGNASNKLKSKIKGISNIERNGAIAVDSYHSTWMGANGEVKALLKLANDATDLMGSTLDFNSINLTTNSPSDLINLLKDINGVDIISDATPKFVSDLFSDLGLNTLTTYDSIDYSYFYLGQKAYGGDGTLGEVSELALLETAINNVSYQDSTGYHYLDLSDMSTVVNQVDSFDGIFNFFSNSLILNTRLDGTKNTMNVVDGKQISARGVLMYNLFNGSGANVRDYIVGTTDLEKIAVLSKIYTFPSYDYIAESRGMHRLLSQANQIQVGDFDTSDLQQVKVKANVLASLISSSYNAYNNKRSYFVSEIMSGIMDEALFNEHNRIISLGLVDGGASFKFESDTYLTLNENSYDRLNEDEKIGFEGVIDMLDLLNHLFDYPSTITRGEIINAFNKMNESEIAKKYYLSRAHQKEASELLYKLDFTQTTEAYYLYGANWNDYTDQIWSNGFNFRDYGVSLANYLGL